MDDYGVEIGVNSCSHRIIDFQLLIEQLNLITELFPGIIYHNLWASTVNFWRRNLRGRLGGKFLPVEIGVLAFGK